MSTVEEVLSIDAKNRVTGVEGDLVYYPIKTAEWGYSYPTIVADEERKVVPEDDAIQFMYKNFPMLEKLDFSNVLLAGGMPSACVSGLQANFGDLDFFIYGLSTEEEATKRAFKLLNDLKDKQCKFVRTRGSITMYSGDQKIKIQVILRLYKSPSEILHGFDLGSCAVGFDGDRLIFTTLSKFCFTYSVNIVDTSRRSTTYEQRLIKYYERGFSIVLPGLDVNKLSVNSPNVHLHNFNFNISKLDGNQIYLKSDIKPDVTIKGGDYAHDQIEEPVVSYFNFKAVESAQEVNGRWIFGGYGISWLYEDVRKAEATFKLPLGDIKRDVIDRIKQREDVLNNVMDSANSSPERVLCKQAAYLWGCTFKEISDGLLSPDWKSFVRGVFQRQLDKVEKFFSWLEKEPEVISWKTAEPGTQLVGSFNPIFADEKDWYGLFYDSKRKNDGGDDSTQPTKKFKLDIGEVLDIILDDE